MRFRTTLSFEHNAQDLEDACTERSGLVVPTGI